MKRMYVTLGVFLLLFVWAVSSFGQKKTMSSQEERLLKHLQMREEIHKRIRDKLIHGFGDDDDLFNGMDDLMEEAMKGSLMGPGSSSFSFSSGSQSNFKLQWSDLPNGKRLAITPQTPEQKLDIDVNANMVTIKGVSKTKSENGVDAVATFRNSFSVPLGCDGTKVKMSQENGNIVLVFPCGEKQIEKISKPKDERKPVGPLGDDVEI